MADPARLRVAALFLFLAASFLLPSGPAYALVFYLAIPPSLVWRPSLPPRDPAFWRGAALIVWSGLTLLWGRDDGGRSFRFAVATICTLAFWVALWGELPLARLRLALAGLGTVNAVLGLVRLVVAPPYHPPGDVLRLHGWGITNNPVLGAAVLSVAWLTALDLALRERRHRAWAIGGMFIMATAVALTRSRGPALALLAGAFVQCAAAWPRLAIAVLTLPPLAWVAGVVRPGTSGHFEAWRLAWSGIGARPLFGNGLAADLPLTYGADKRFPHDLVLSLLFYSGAVGLALFLGLLATVTMRVVRARDAWVGSLLVSGLVAGLTDFGQISKGPGPLWLIIWLPLALAARASAGAQQPRTVLVEPGDGAGAVGR